MMHAIETIYKGYRFRSRLEARYAVFLDLSDIKWDYEIQGFDLDNSHQYLPDFWIPYEHRVYQTAGYWLEIKGLPPNNTEKELATKLAQYTKHTTFIAYGYPGENPLYWFHNSGNFGLAETIGNFRQQYPKISNLMPLLCHYIIDGTSLEKIKFAIKEAKQARWEHGQYGPPSSWNNND